jgi:hypothetical protein
MLRISTDSYMLLSRLDREAFLRSLLQRLQQRYPEMIARLEGDAAAMRADALVSWARAEGFQAQEDIAQLIFLCLDVGGEDAFRKRLETIDRPDDDLQGHARVLWLRHQLEGMPDLHVPAPPPPMPLPLG